MHSMTFDEVKQFLRATDNPSDHLFVLTTFYHGLRVSEALNLRVRDCAGGYITVPRVKGSLKTTHQLIASDDPLLDEQRALDAVIRAKDLAPEDRLFARPGCDPKNERFYYNKLFIRLGSRIGLPRHLLTPHILKHSIAMHLVARIPINKVQTFLGHRSLASTGRYLKVSDSQASQAVTEVFRSDENAHDKKKDGGL